MVKERGDVDVAIVGAGLAGLTAAHRLAAAGASVLVFEARERVGGRTVKQLTEDGTVVEMGGRYVGVTQERVYALAAELGVETFRAYFDGETIALIGGKRYRYGGELPRMNPLALADLAQTATRLDRLAARVPVERPWDAPRAGQLDAQTLEGWLRRTAKTEKARKVLRLYLGMIFGAEPSNVSLLHALFYVHSATNFEVISGDGVGSAQQDRFVGGSHALSLALTEQLDGAIELGVPVRRVAQSDASVRIETDRFAVSARRVVIAIPPTLAARITYDPPLPAERDQLLQRLPEGTYIAVSAVYDEPFWRRDGLSGLAWSPDLPVSAVLDNSPPQGSPGVLAAFLKGTNARLLGREGPEARRKVVLDCLTDYHGPGRASPKRITISIGPRSRSRGALRAPSFPRGRGPSTGPSSERRSVGSTGPARKPHRSGTATWTGPCALESRHRRRS
jgi:monoamine oxidase